MSGDSNLGRDGGVRRNLALGFSPLRRRVQQQQKQGIFVLVKRKKLVDLRLLTRRLNVAGQLQLQSAYQFQFDTRSNSGFHTHSNLFNIPQIA